MELRLTLGANNIHMLLKSITFWITGVDSQRRQEIFPFSITSRVSLLSRKTPTEQET
jgi:hypothetical protein